MTLDVWSYTNIPRLWLGEKKKNFLVIVSGNPTVYSQSSLIYSSLITSASCLFDWKYNTASKAQPKESFDLSKSVSCLKLWDSQGFSPFFPLTGSYHKDVLYGNRLIWSLFIIGFDWSKRSLIQICWLACLSVPLTRGLYCLSLCTPFCLLD